MYVHLFIYIYMYIVERLVLLFESNDSILFTVRLYVNEETYVGVTMFRNCTCRTSTVSASTKLYLYELSLPTIRFTVCQQ